MLDENEMLKENLEAQLERLVQQLSDLEECRYGRHTRRYPSSTFDYNYSFDSDRYDFLNR